MATFVTGLDDSSHAARALRWALEEAGRHGARLVVLHAWDWPYGGELGALAAELLRTKEFRDAAPRVLAAMVQAARGPEWPDVEVEERVVEGSPAGALLDAAEGADLLVVGSRGRGGFAGLLLGSVSQQCAEHATCPVVIVPSRQGVRRGGDPAVTRHRLASS